MSKLHCANCGRPWTATDGDNGCCWNESICALAIAGRRSPPAPAIDVAELVGTVTSGLKGCGFKEDARQTVEVEIRGAVERLERRGLVCVPKPAIDVEGLDDALMRVRAHIDDAGNYTGLVYRAEVEQVIRVALTKNTDAQR